MGPNSSLGTLIVILYVSAGMNVCTLGCGSGCYLQLVDCGICMNVCVCYQFAEVVLE